MSTKLRCHQGTAIWVVETEVIDINQQSGSLALKMRPVEEMHKKC